MRWVIDGNNVMGAGGDGWWNDRAAAAVRTAEAIAVWCRTHDDPVDLVFDEPSTDRLALVAGGNLTIGHASRRGRDAADDTIAELVEAAVADVGEAAEESDSSLTVVTSDRGLRSRLPDDVAVEGAGAFRRRVGLPMR